MGTKGTLYIVATPIGNLGDITQRAVDVLRTADLIAAEDTRHTAKLLSHLDIHKEVVSFHEHSKSAQAQALIERLEKGESIALVSDAGTPLISDPGLALVRRCITADIPLSVLPGPSAMTAAIAVSGIDCRRFVFAGFLASKQVPRRQELVQLSEADLPIVIYESPNRVKDLLEDISFALGADTIVCAARELTKIHEEILRGECASVLSILNSRESIKGEFVVICDAHRNVKEMEDDEIREALLEYIGDGMSRKDAVQYAAAVLGQPKKRIYRISLDMGQKSDS